MRGVIYLFLILLNVGYGCKSKATTVEYKVKVGSDNLAYKWAALSLDATARDTDRYKPRPTVTSRYLGLVFVAVFDAWSRYDSLALPVYLEAVGRRPVSEMTEENKEIAISYAAYRVMSEFYKDDQAIFDKFMRELGYDPSDQSQDRTNPIGIGNLAALAIVNGRRNDGANQYGEEAGSDGRPYYNYVQYQPVHGPDQNNDINRWQPKYFVNSDGEKFAPDCLTPYWDKVRPISLKSSDQFRPGPPPMYGSAQLEEEVREVLALQANLTDYQKALVEFMRDGPQSVQQAGHWLKFAQEVSVRDNHTMDEDVKMYFFNQVVAMDAFIAAWDCKMHYDFARPFALVHQYFGDHEIFGWGGEGKGMISMKGSEWRPYSPASFLCPPFPSYVSGHSVVSAACAEALRLWTGSDYFGSSATMVAGSLTEPGYKGETIILQFPTFTETAQMAGISRVLGGYHIQADNVAGLDLGRKVANEAWKFYQQHIGK